jgi:hypothetical protein
MNKKFKYFLITCLVGICTVFGVWQYVHKAPPDNSDKKPDVTFTFPEIMEKVSKDTASLSQLKDKIVCMKGCIKKISIDSNSTTIQIGDTNSLSCVICQIDSRHQDEFKSCKVLDPIAIQGFMTGYAIDNDLGLGNTVEMNFCSQFKNK